MGGRRRAVAPRARRRALGHDDPERAPCAADDAPLDLAAAATADGKLRQLFKKAYAGFDDDDWKKVQAWAQSKELA